jgi:hypothetical protein
MIGRYILCFVAGAAFGILAGLSFARLCFRTYVQVNGEEGLRRLFRRFWRQIPRERRELFVAEAIRSCIRCGEDLKGHTCQEKS